LHKKKNIFEINQQRKSTWSEKLAWGAGGMTESLVNCLYSLAFPIFAIGLGVSPALIGISQAISRLVDAFTDPVMGNISDNTRTRFGRRRPFIFAGAILVGITFPLIYMPGRDWSEWGCFLWYTGLSSLFFIAFTIWSIPWSALGLELSDDYRDRTKIQLSRMVFATLAGIGVTWAYRLCFIFHTDELIGVRYVGWLIGAVMCVTGILSALFIREWRQVGNQAPIKLLSALKLTCSNRPFLLLCGAVLFFAGGLVMVGPMLLYVNIYYVFDGDRATAATLCGVAGTVTALLSVGMLPLGGKIVDWIGKRRAAFLALGMIVIGQCSLFVLIRPSMPYLQLLSMIIYQPGIMLMWALIPSMIADVCDMDELESGRRREASYSSMYQWIWKLGATLAMMLGGFLLGLVGAKTSSPDAMLAPEVVFKLRLLLSGVPTLLGIAAAVCLWHYPLTEANVEKIKMRLKESDI
jgi:GPH family glycoside/pentoside/hexuronide:cation symporter